MLLNSVQVRGWVSPWWLTYRFAVSGVDSMGNDVRPAQIVLVLRESAGEFSQQRHQSASIFIAHRFIHIVHHTDGVGPGPCPDVVPPFCTPHTCAESRSEMIVPAFMTTGLLVRLMTQTGTSSSRSGTTVLDTQTPAVTSRASVTQSTNSLLFGPER